MLLRQEIMALPEQERLPYALELLEEMTGSKLENQMWLKEKYRLSMTEANLFLMLNNNSPRTMTREAIFKSIWGDTEVEISIISVMVCNIRKKGLTISNNWGIGYFVPDRIEVGESMKYVEANRMKVWTAENDADLIAMVKAGSSLRSMAYETDRTERAVNDRIRRLKSDGKLSCE